MFDKKTIILLAGFILAIAVPLGSAHLSSSGSATSALFSDGDNCRYEGKANSCIGNSGVSGSYVAGPANRYVPGQDVSGFALCDQEVQGDGSAPSPEDESNVDGAPGGAMPDGTWDDGGIGGACHTNNHYSNAEYNTPGCGDGETYAVAEDRVSGGNVWIGVFCDYMTTATGGCGSDGIPDAMNYGPGGGSLPATSVGVLYPTVPTSCDPSDGVAMVLVFNYVGVNGVVPATSGWIDSRNL